MGPLIREREISSAGTQVPNDSLTLCSPVSSCYLFLPTSSEPISRLKIRIQRLGSSGTCLPNVEHDIWEWAEIPAHLGAIFASQSCPAWGTPRPPARHPRAQPQSSHPPATPSNGAGAADAFLLPTSPGRGEGRPKDGRHHSCQRGGSVQVLQLI